MESGGPRGARFKHFDLVATGRLGDSGGHDPAGAGAEPWDCRRTWCSSPVVTTKPVPRLAPARFARVSALSRPEPLKSSPPRWLNRCFRGRCSTAFIPATCTPRAACVSPSHSTTSAASCLKWWRDQFGAAEARQAARQGRDAYQVIDEHMPEGPSPVLFLPHLNGSGTPACDLQSKGAVVGLTLSNTAA